MYPLLFRISEYIPPRPALPRKLGGAEKAVSDFHVHTASIANTLLEDFRYTALYLSQGAKGEITGLYLRTYTILALHYTKTIVIIYHYTLWHVLIVYVYIDDVYTGIYTHSIGTSKLLNFYMLF